MSNADGSADILFRLLSKLTNEDLPETESEAELRTMINTLQELTGRKLFQLLEETSYPQKYDLYRRMEELLRSVKLQMLLPEAINKYVVGFYQPNTSALRWIEREYLKGALYKSLFGKQPFSKSVPTLLTHGEEKKAKIYALSAGEKRVELENEEYAELLYRDRQSDEDEARVELASVTNLIQISCDQIDSALAILILPDNCDSYGKYYKTLFDMIDTLVLFCGKETGENLRRIRISQERNSGGIITQSAQLESLIYNSNVKHIIADGSGGSAMRTAAHFAELARESKTVRNIKQIISDGLNREALQNRIADLFTYTEASYTELDTEEKEVSISESASEAAENGAVELDSNDPLRRQEDEATESILLKRFSPCCHFVYRRAEWKAALLKAFPRLSNFNVSLRFRLIFSELLWHFGEERQRQQLRLTQINPDLLERSDAKKFIKKMQKELHQQLENSDALISDSLKLQTEMLNCLMQLEKRLDIDEHSDYYDFHAIAPDELLGHFYRMSVFFQEIELGKQAKEVEKLYAFCKDHADGQISDIILNDYRAYVGSQRRKGDQVLSFSENMKHLKSYPSHDPFFLRLKIRHRDVLELSDEDCGKIISGFPPPLSPEERRMLGIYFYGQGDIEAARQELHHAMSQGNANAGELYAMYYSNESAAKFGVPTAALCSGKQYMLQWEKKQNSKTLFSEAVRYLNIAAASGLAEGYAQLSELWYKSGAFHGPYEIGENEENSCFRACLDTAQHCPESLRNNTHLGIAAYYLKDYLIAMEHLKKADTADSHALLGKMYENGTGAAKNVDAALKEYKRAIALGNTQLKAEYDRLYAKAQNEKKKQEKSEASDYRSTSTVSNTSYSSW